MEIINNSCLSITTSNSVFLLIIGLLSLILIRVLYVIHQSSQLCGAASQQKPFSTLIVLGSGGHTAEMINLLNALQKNRFKPRYYIAAATDNMSLQKAQVLENSLLNEGGVEEVGSAQFMQIYRSREILCNGPGTCIPLCVIAFIFKVFGIRWSYIFYVESIARVRRLSLSALLLYKLRMADQIFVQWPQLKSKYPRAHYVGRLM